MPKNIVIFSDGTGQGASGPGKAGGTNVYKLYLATRSVDPARQTAFYDPGLGSDPDTDGLGWTRWGYNLLSKATGLGISRNIKDCYEALIERWEPDDRIFLFGFSRGAYTVRSLGGALGLCGIPARDASGRSTRTDRQARRNAVEEAVEKVYKTYAASHDPADIEQAAQRRKELGAAFRTARGATEVAPYFIGVWDTVRALGLPYVSQALAAVGLSSHAFHNADLSEKVPHARQALAIDENRDIFGPVLWSETPALRASGRISQRWFAGDHSDIGGGHRETGLSDVALDWMFRQAMAVKPHGLLVDQATLATQQVTPDPLGVQHNPRSGLGLLWSPGVRRLSDWDLFDEAPVKARFLAADAPTETGRAPYDPEGARGNGQARAWVAQREGA
jgi:uncharacterized protein (DUF2235 family)